MSHLQYHNYAGVGSLAKEQFGYSQAVRVGNQIHISGQGGWDPHAAEGKIVFAATNVEQIDQTFKNVELALQTAGGTGWDQVFSMRSYHIPLVPEVLEAMTRNLKKYAPHGPIWTAIGVPTLGMTDMKVEIEVIADLGSAENA